MRAVDHFIDGRIWRGATSRTAEVFNPATGDVEATVSMGDAHVVEVAVKTAKVAQRSWAAATPQRRARVMMNFVTLLNQNMAQLAELMSREHGKTLADSIGDLQRGLEVGEFSIGIPHLLKGEFTEGAGPGIDMYSLRQPMGVGAGITPFNFPGMIPMWMFAPAIVCGNAFILKPSERNPSVPVRLAELMLEAGLPPGVFNVVHGDKETVTAIIEHRDVAAVSFVGSTPAAAQVYASCAAHGKRVQCFGGAKNHAIIMPDAPLDLAADALIGASFGSAGERCMALSVAVPVGEETADRLVHALKSRVESLKIGPYTSEKVDFGPVITRAAVERINSLIGRGVSEGASLIVDGRNFQLQGYENGFFVGATLVDHVTSEMEIYRAEIFGPVLSVVRPANYEDALRLVNDHEYGNGSAIFTQNGGAARDFANRVQTGMVGINVPIPTPLAYYSFGGWKRSAFGDLNQHGPDSIKFWTKPKTVTSRWPSRTVIGSEFAMPVFDNLIRTTRT